MNEGAGSSDPRGGTPSEDRTETQEAADIIASMGDPTLLRSAAAVVLGFAVLTLVSVAAGRAVIEATGIGPEDAPTAGFLAASLGSRLLIAVGAGWLTAKAAPRAALLHAGVLAAVLTLFSVAAIAGLRAGGGAGGPAWYPIVMLVLGPGGVLAGGLLHGSRSGSR